MRHPIPVAGAFGALVVLGSFPAALVQDKKPDSSPQSAAAAEPAAFVEKALAWLVTAQQPDGGYGAGSHARQEVRDAHAVPSDPATTAVAGLALLRAQRGLDGRHREAVLRASEYLLRTVEQAPDAGPKITDRTGTQPQAKMGENVDTALTAQYLARLLDTLGKDAPLRPRVVKALDKCLDKIEKSQSKEGTWVSSGWAPVLQASQMTTALELGQQAGRPVDAKKLASAREYQKRQVDGSGRVSSGAAAGVALYASASNMRAVAAEAKAAEEIVAASRPQGLPSGKMVVVSKEALESAGVAAPQADAMARSHDAAMAGKGRAFDAQMLEGFGSNGGEEFLSYQMTSESLAIAGGPEWTKWSAQIRERLAKVQNADGSWSGHHCITSPVFCTATAISCLTAEHDVEWLRRTAKK